MAKKQMKPVEIKQDDGVVDTFDVPDVNPDDIVGDNGVLEPFDTTTEQPIAVDVLEPVVTYTPAAGDPLLPVRLELPQAVLFALIDAEHPDADLIGAAYYGLVALDGLTPLGEKVLAGIDQTALRHKMNAAWRIEQNRRIDRGM